VVRRGKGQKDRRVMLPETVRDRLRRHLDLVHRQHVEDLAAGFGRVVLPAALDRKFPNAAPTGAGSSSSRPGESVGMGDTVRLLAITYTSR